MNAETVITRKQETRLGDRVTTVRTYGKDDTGVTVCLREEITIEGPPEFTLAQARVELCSKRARW